MTNRKQQFELREMCILQTAEQFLLCFAIIFDSYFCIKYLY